MSSIDRGAILAALAQTPLAPIQRMLVASAIKRMNDSALEKYAGSMFQVARALQDGRETDARAVIVSEMGLPAAAADMIVNLIKQYAGAHQNQ